MKQLHFYYGVFIYIFFVSCSKHLLIEKTIENVEINDEEQNTLSEFQMFMANDPNYLTNWNTALNSSNCVYSSFPQVITAPWKQIGIDTQPISTPAAEGQTGGTGLVTFLEKDPQNPNHIFTGSAISGCGPSGMFHSYNGGETWQNAGTDLLEPEMGVVTVAVDPTNSNVWYIGSQGNANSHGIYKTTDAGLHYTKIWSFYTANTCYAPARGGWYDMNKIIINPSNNNEMYCANSHGLYKCANLTSTNPIFTLCNTPGTLYSKFYDVDFVPGNPNIVIACADSSKYRPNCDLSLPFVYDDAKIVISTDAGATWNLLNTAPASTFSASDMMLYAERITVATTPADPNLLYILVRKDPDNDPTGDNLSSSENVNTKFFIFNGANQTIENKGWLYKYDQLGLPVDNVTYLGCNQGVFGVSPHRMNSLAVSPTNKDKVIVGDVKNMMCFDAVSSSGIPSWFSLPNQYHDDVAINVFKDGNTIYTGTDGGVFKSSDLGGTWVAVNNGLAIADILKFDMSQTDKDFFTFGNYHCGTTIKTNGVWKHINDGDGLGTQINYLDNNKIISSSQEGGIDLSADLGYSNISFSSTQDWYTEVAINSGDPNTFFTNQNASGYTNIKRVKDCWSASPISAIISNFQTNGIATGNINWRLCTSSHNPDFLLVAMIFPGTSLPSKMFYTTIANDPNPAAIIASWVQIPTQPYIKWISDIWFDENDENTMWIANGNGTTFIDNKILRYNITSQTYIDLTRNLPECITASAVIKPKNSSSLYIGSSNHGVWYLEDQYDLNSQWVLLNNNLPNGSVADLKILECENKLRVALSGRGLWECPLVKLDAQIIANNTIFSSPMVANRTIVIESGTLTVTNKIEISSDAKIIVKRGAQLIIEGPNAKITNACQARWPGIQVWGNSNVSQNITNAAEFGKVIVRNGGTIENAETGITTMKIDDQGNWDWNYSGGIVQCTDANFINNGHDVGFLNYANHNANGQEMITQSYFTRTNFITNANYNYKEFGAADWHVTIDHSSGIRFKGCTFKNLNATTPADYSGNEHLWAGGGIYAINSQLFVDQYCSGFSINCNNAIPTTFENLREGISVTGTLKNRKLNCLNSEFVNNATNGISVRSQNYANIISNDFIYNTNNLYPYEVPSGFYQIGTLISQSTGYRVEENNFTGNSNNTLVQAGIKIVNSGGAPNEIYRNTFTNLYYGATALGTNKNTKINSNGVGLQLLCLTHQNNKWDNAVTKKVNEPGIALYQGNLLGPNFRTADNTFSNITGTVCTDVFNYYNECQFINYAGSNNLQYSPTLYDCNSIYVSNNIATNTGCPTKIGLHKKLNATEQQTVVSNLDSKMTDFGDSKLLLNLITDGGNTNDVINAITQSQPAQTQQLVSNLLSLSPNVSLPVLLKVAYEDDKLSPTLQMLILVANTQGGKNQRIIDTLRNKQNPMDPAMVDFILDNRNNTSLKEKMESKVATLASEKDYLALVLINDLMEDTTGVNSDSLALLIDKLEGDDKYYTKIYKAIADNNFNLSDSLYTALGDSIDDKYLRADYESMEQILEIEKALKNSNRNYHQLDTLEIETLREIALDEYAAKGMVMAQNILSNAVGDKFEPYLKFPEEVQERRSNPAQKQTIITTSFESSFFNLYPNPTKSQTNLSYVIFPGQKGVASISDSNGKVVYETVLPNNQNSLSIDLSNFAPSAYYLNVIINNIVVYKETLVVRK